MPIFEYVCRGCDERFETLVTASRQPSCPSCHGTGLDKQLSVFAVSAKSGAGSGHRSPQQPQRVTGSCGACGDPRGPGSCSVN